MYPHFPIGTGARLRGSDGPGGVSAIIKVYVLFFYEAQGCVLT